ARLTRRPAGLPTDSSLRSASVFDGAPQIKIKIKSDSLRIVDTLFVFCRSRLAGEKRETAAFIQMYPYYR
uniref:hypothetical protein n=1 Tax=Pseudomonas canadensis TaxID=915099 RepID=UPI0030DCAD29